MVQGIAGLGDVRAEIAWRFGRRGKGKAEAGVEPSEPVENIKKNGSRYKVQGIGEAGWF
jgi:hypothetical protein